jgi:hypothetical protein
MNQRRTAGHASERAFLPRSLACGSHPFAGEENTRRPETPGEGPMLPLNSAEMHGKLSEEPLSCVTAHSTARTALNVGGKSSDAEMYSRQASMPANNRTMGARLSLDSS